MLKRIARYAFLAVFSAIVVCTPISASAVESITSVMGFSATLYLSDWVDQSVIMTNVKPVLVSNDSTAAAKEIEYNAIPAFSGNIFTKSGDELDLSSLAWYVDTEVRFVAARLDSGEYRIINILTR